MKTFILFCIISEVLSSHVLGQDTSVASYYPTSVGNTWVYNYGAYGNLCFCSQRIRTKIIGSVNRNSKTYYIFQSTALNYSGGGCWILSATYDTTRIDPVTGNILRFTQNGGCYLLQENVIDSLRSKKYDTLKTCGYSVQSCLDTGLIPIFGFSKLRKSFGVMYVDSYWGRSYVQGFGYTSYGAGGQTCTSQLSITGCIINGIVYGDTSFILGIIKISSEVPESFSLSQNYPNPFNPTTKIQYQIAKNSHVELKIFDATGHQIATLVNEQQTPGTYEAEFDGSGYASGVYFYKITTDDFTQTKKMVLIK